MAYDKVAYDALSNNWRVFCLSLDSASRDNMIECMLAATSVKNRRNVELWFSTSSTYRKILNRTLAADEFDLRMKIIKSCLRLNNENVPLKGVFGNSSPLANANKFADYVKHHYTGKYTRIIQFSPTGFTLFYDMYGTGDGSDDDLIDEDFFEFTEDTLPTEITEDFF